MYQQIGYDLSAVLPAVEQAGLFVSLATIQSPSQAPDSLGQPDLVDWTDVLVNIPCMIAPEGVGTPPIGDEMAMREWIAEKTEFHVLLDGYYPTILQRYRAVIDGIPLDIKAVESDSQKIMTRLAVRRYSL